jgi:hypothetical protein
MPAAPAIRTWFYVGVLLCLPMASVLPMREGRRLRHVAVFQSSLGNLRKHRTQSADPSIKLCRDHAGSFLGALYSAAAVSIIKALSTSAAIWFGFARLFDIAVHRREIAWNLVVPELDNRSCHAQFSAIRIITLL